MAKGKNMGMSPNKASGPKPGTNGSGYNPNKTAGKGGGMQISGGGHDMGLPKSGCESSRMSEGMANGTDWMEK